MVFYVKKTLNFGMQKRLLKQRTSMVLKNFEIYELDHLAIDLIYKEGMLPDPNPSKYLCTLYGTHEKKFLPLSLHALLLCNSSISHIRNRLLYMHLHLHQHLTSPEGDYILLTKVSPFQIQLCSWRELGLAKNMGEGIPLRNHQDLVHIFLTGKYKRV